MGRLTQYPAVYKHFLATSIAQQSSFRVNFVLLIVMDILFYVSTLATVSFIFDHVGSVGGWSREQFSFFVAFMLAVDHLHMTFISESFWEFSFSIRTGGLDFTLIKPVDPLFAIFLRMFRPASLLNVWIPWTAMYYFGSRAGLTALDALLVPPLVLTALTLLVLLEILISMLMFWTVEAWGINFLRIQLQAMSRWPDLVFRAPWRWVFTFWVPVLLVGSAPVHFLFDKGRFALLGAAFAAMAVLAGLIGLAWRAGLRSYESASS
jgi:ABC-2 type transport system permease protein